METAACDCGAVETSFLSVGEDGPCETCGVSKTPEVSDGCFSCGSVDRAVVRSYYQGCSSCSRTRGRRSTSTRVGVFGVLAAVSALFGGGSYERPVEDPAAVTFLGNIPKKNSWWDAAGGVASVWGRRPKADELSSPSVQDRPFETCLLQRSGEAWRLWDTRATSQSRSGSRSSGRGAARSGQKGSATSGLKGSAAARMRARRTPPPTPATT